MTLFIPTDAPRAYQLLASSLEKKDMVGVLSSFILGADARSPIARLAIYLSLDQPHVLEALLTLGIDPNETVANRYDPSHPMTPLKLPLIFHCIEQWNLDALNVLVSSGKCDLNRKDSSGNTVLHHLAKTTSVPTQSTFTARDRPLTDDEKSLAYDLLTKNGADQMLTNNAGLTASQLMKTEDQLSRLALSHGTDRSR